MHYLNKNVKLKEGTAPEVLKGNWYGKRAGIMSISIRDNFKLIRSDGGGEYFATIFQKWFKD